MNNVVAYYDKIAGIYDEDRFNNTYGKFIDRQERKILDSLLNGKNEIIVDLACGSGRLLNYATCGVDASREMIKIAKQKFPEKKIYLSDAGRIPLEDGAVDTIISFHFFMHLDEIKMYEILLECNRVLKKGGRVIFDIPSGKRRRLLRYKTTNWHGAFSTTLSRLKEITSNNFVLLHTTGVLFFPIHRFPAKIRKFFIKADFLLARSFLKEYSSYFVVELVKK